MESDTSSSSRTVRSKEPEQRATPGVDESMTGKLQPCILWSVFFYTNDKSYFSNVIGITFLFSRFPVGDERGRHEKRREIIVNTGS